MSSISGDTGSLRNREMKNIKREKKQRVAEVSHDGSDSGTD